LPPFSHQNGIVVFKLPPVRSVEATVLAAAARSHEYRIRIQWARLDREEVAMRRGIGEGLQLGRTLLVLFGIWLTISPWMFGDAVFDHALQITITGVLLVLTAGASVLFGSATALPLWFALVLGWWTMAAPIMFGLSGRSFSANNDIVVGLLVLLAAAVAIASQARMRIFAGRAEPHGAAGQTSLW